MVAEAVRCPIAAVLVADAVVPIVGFVVAALLSLAAVVSVDRAGVRGVGLGLAAQVHRLVQRN